MRETTTGFHVAWALPAPLDAPEGGPDRGALDSLCAALERRYETSDVTVEAGSAGPGIIVVRFDDRAAAHAARGVVRSLHQGHPGAFCRIIAVVDVVDA